MKDICRLFANVCFFTLYKLSTGKRIFRIGLKFSKLSPY